MNLTVTADAGKRTINALLFSRLEYRTRTATMFTDNWKLSVLSGHNRPSDFITPFLRRCTLGPMTRCDDNLSVLFVS